MIISNVIISKCDKAVKPPLTGVFNGLDTSTYMRAKISLVISPFLVNWDVVIFLSKQDLHVSYYIIHNQNISGVLFMEF